MNLITLLTIAQLAGQIQSFPAEVPNFSLTVLQKEAEILRNRRWRAEEYLKTGPKYEFRQAKLLDYNIDCQINPLTQHLATKAKVSFQSRTEGLTDLILVMYDDNLVIDYVKLGNDTLVYSYDAYWGLITITLPAPMLLDQIDSLEISYNGDLNDYVTGMYYGSGQLDSIYSFATYCPDLWYPTSYENYFSDRLDEKYAGTIKLTVPFGYVALSNGELTDSGISDGQKIYQWEVAKPVTEFNFAISPYLSSLDSFGGIPLTCYDPDSADSRDQMLGYMKRAVTLYSQIFCNYNLGKLALADNGKGFGYAGNSLVIMPSPYEYWMVSHEVAHEWWGRMVTPRYWDEIWLNEGFASYTEALFAEDTLGKSELDEHMYGNGQAYKSVVHIYTDYPIVPAPFSAQTYHQIVYCKGSWVLHMLRGVMGDSSFFSLMTKYAQDFCNSDSSATIAAFRQYAEQEYGSDLGWFFDEWIYHCGYPYYRTTVFINTHDGNRSAHIKIWQTSSSTSDPVVFKMPLEFKVKCDSFWSGTITLWDSLTRQEFWVSDSLPIDSISFDRDQKLLKDSYNYLPYLSYLTPLSDSGKPRVITVWKPFVGDSSCKYFNVYRGTSRGGPFTRINANMVEDTLFTDTTVSTDIEYFYGIAAVDSADTCYETFCSNILSTTVTGITDGPNNVGPETGYALRPNAPNPFSRITEIRYQLSQSGKVSVRVYNVAGQLVRTLVQGTQAAGEHTAGWDGRDESGAKVPSGIYFTRLETEGRVFTRTLQYIK
jgi:aminopeptidase N